MGAETTTFFAPAGDALAVHTVASLRAPAVELGAKGRRTAAQQEAEGTNDILRFAPKAVLFDAENVFHDSTGWSRWLVQVFARIEPRSLEAAFARLWREKVLPAVQRGEREFHASFSDCLRAVGLAPAHVEEIVAASRAQRRRQTSGLRPLPGVRSTLSCLRGADIALGVLANTDQSAAALTQDLARLGLDGLFSKVLTSVDLGANLSDARCYRTALAAINAAANEVLFVGHAPAALDGARRAGLAVAAINAGQTPQGVDRMDRFDDLLGLIAGHSAACS